LRAITRRTFNHSVALGAAFQAFGTAQTRAASQYSPTEWSFSSAKAYRDPFNEVELDVVVQTPSGGEERAPAFWAGGQTWRVRYAARAPGRHSWRTVCSDGGNRDLHGVTGVLEAAAVESRNPLIAHGPIRVSADKRHFEHADGTPFFWLGDTWWMGLCQRLAWPNDVRILAEDRVRKGFTVIQIVAGLYPDMPQFDHRGANEAGYPWQADYTRINPEYFDMADLRIDYLVSKGLAPCIVGCWGYYLPILGEKRMKQHWRYLVARWGALPVFWCLAGEGSMPYYLSKTREQDAAAQKHGWTEMGRYVRSIDPYHRPITIHPSTAARVTVDDPTVLDFDMLQTGHNDRRSIPNTIRLVTQSRDATPTMPVLVGEVDYEGIMEASRQEVQRFLFWSCMLSGAGGHTYGANGMWQVNTPDKPFGASPHGRSWGDTPWQTAYQLPGSEQLGIAKKLLMRYDWTHLEPHPEWVEPHWTPEDYVQAYAAGIPGKIRIIFFPVWGSPTVKGLEAGAKYSAVFFNPVNGREYPLGSATGDAQGNWKPPAPPIFQDWVLLMEKV
jgi:Protein of unknown function (DUF4038)/Domain of unknown function (DUF5060)